MIDMLVVFIATIIYIIALFIFVNLLLKKKSNDNLKSISSIIYNNASKYDDFPEGFIEFLENNINGTNRYKIKNNIYE